MGTAKYDERAYPGTEHDPVPPAGSVVVLRADLLAALDVLDESVDSGPAGEGWKSPELRALVERLRGIANR